MSASFIANGTESATASQVSSQLCAESHARLQTINDLLQAMNTVGKPATGMVMTTVRHLSAFTGQTINDLPIESLIEIGSAFALYLKEHRYQDNSVRTYRRHAQGLLRTAREFGWTPDSQPISDEWQPVAAALERSAGATKGVVRFAVRERISPGDFSNASLEAWARWMKRRGKKHITVRKLASRFRKAVVDSGLEPHMPKLNCRPHPADYRVKTEHMPEPLKGDVVALLKWKTDRYAKGRPKGGRLRPVSAIQLSAWIERLYGFATNVAKLEIHSLAELFSEDVMEAFVDWAVNVRNMSRNSLIKITAVYAAMRHNPKYRDREWDWFSDLLQTFPEDLESDRLARKLQKMLPYDEVAKIPGRIRAEQDVCSSEKQKARLAHDALLIEWETVLPWRQRNLRECRIGDEQSANLFEAELPTAGQHVARPKWVEEAYALNSKERFWQFYFRAEETKTGQCVRAILPRRLIVALEEYLAKHRPLLVGKSDPGTLFLNRRGGPLTAQQTTELVAELTLKHGGRRVSPHLLRSVFAYKWLENFPEDFLSLSKILWHRDVKTTLRIYGGNFNESNGVRRVDEWLGTKTS